MLKKMEISAERKEMVQEVQRGHEKAMMVLPPLAAHDSIPNHDPGYLSMAHSEITLWRCMFQISTCRISQIHRAHMLPHAPTSDIREPLDILMPVHTVTPRIGALDCASTLSLTAFRGPTYILRNSEFRAQKPPCRPVSAHNG